MYLSENEIRIIAAQIIDCLFYMHSKGIIYGDLKAENILISSNGTIKICDFNLSGTCSLLKNDIQGTISYLSPEMINCCERTPKSDFWSLGVLLHLLYYRKYPFQNFKNSNMLVNILNVNIISEPRNRKASYELRSLIYSLLEKDLDLRIGEDKRQFENQSFLQNLIGMNILEKKIIFNMLPIIILNKYQTVKTIIKVVFRVKTQGFFIMITQIQGFMGTISKALHLMLCLQMKLNVVIYLLLFKFKP
jgi:serine/threonine protein kinase